MSFLAPLFLVGAVAIAAPIIFHLIRRTVKDRVRFSTLMFLKESPPRLTKRSHLENILLLILRCAVICLLAMSFARPYFQRAVNEPPKPKSGKRTLILIDTSASMRRSGLFDKAKSLATAALRKADNSDPLAIVTFDSAPHTVFSFEQWQSTPPAERIASAQTRIDSATTTWQSTHLGKAITAASELITDAARGDTETTRSQIILISDLQQGARLDGLQGFEWPRVLEISIQSVAQNDTGNAGVQILAPTPGESLSVTNISLRARVVNSPGAKVEQFKLGWAGANGAFSSTPVEMHVPAGQNRAITLPASATNATQLSLLLTGDADTFDNRAYHAAPPRQSLRVTYLGKENPDDPEAQLFYIRRAFPETAALAVKVDARDPGANGPIQGSLIIAPQLSAADAPELKNALQAGATILITVQSNTDLSPLPSIADATDASISNLKSQISNSASSDKFVLLAQIDFDHPLFTQFRDARFNDFTKIHFWNHRKIEMPKASKARVIGSFDDNSPALMQIPTAKGALYILASSWAPSDSQLALSTKFLPLIYSLLEQSAPITTQARQLTIGDAVPFPGEFTGETIALKKPDGTSVQWRKSEAFTGTDQPGFYSATQPPLLFAVNLDPTESRTAPIPEEQLASLGLPLKHEEVATTPQAEKKREQLLLATEQESRQKIWRRLLVAALAILLVETLLARRASAPKAPIPA